MGTDADATKALDMPAGHPSPADSLNPIEDPRGSNQIGSALMGKLSWLPGPRKYISALSSDRLTRNGYGIARLSLTTAAGDNVWLIQER
jgi:hypothetical protein